MSATANFKKLVKGEVLSEQQFYRVIAVEGTRVTLKNDHGTQISVDSGYVNSCLLSAAQFSETKMVSRTEAATIFLSSTGVAITVNFNKQVKDADVVTEIMTAYEGSTPKQMETAVKKAVKKALSGEERTMTGYYHGAPNEFGRVNFVDMEVEREKGKDYDNRLRQVDPRTLNWFIVRGIKYTVK
jgi:hypothetical protein